MRDYGIVPDRLDATREVLRKAAAENDVIVTSGGVSVGDEDHVKPAVEAEGSLLMWKIAMKPGRPLGVWQGWQCGIHRAARQPGFELRDLPYFCPAFSSENPRQYRIPNPEQLMRAPISTGPSPMRGANSCA